MPIFKMPSALRLLYAVIFLLLLMMTGYRVFLLAIFSLPTTPKFLILFSGLILDSGAVAFFGLVFLGLSFFRSLHPYRSKKGLYFSLGYLSFSLLLILTVYAIDLVSIKTFGQRISGTKLVSIFRDNPHAGTFLSNFPILPYIIGVTLTGWVFWLLIKWLHIRLGLLDRAYDKKLRFAWHSTTIVVFISLIWLGANLTIPYQLPTDLSLGRSFVSAVKANPIFNLIFL